MGTAAKLTVKLASDLHRAMWVQVADVEQASAQVRGYIDMYGLGSSDWAGGELRLDGKKIGRISYNGRAWNNDGTEMEIAK